MPNKRKGSRQPHQKLKYGRNPVRVLKNKERRKTKRLLEREKAKENPSKNTKIVTCVCGKEVKINKYKTRDSYYCAKCRGLTKK